MLAYFARIVTRLTSYIMSYIACASYQFEMLVLCRLLGQLPDCGAVARLDPLHALHLLRPRRRRRRRLPKHFAPFYFVFVAKLLGFFYLGTSICLCTTVLRRCTIHCPIMLSISDCAVLYMLRARTVNATPALSLSKSLSFALMSPPLLCTGRALSVVTICEHLLLYE